MSSDDIRDGDRYGRFVVLRDADGALHAVTAAAVSAVCEVDGSSLVLLPGGRMLRIEQPLLTVLSWFEVGVRARTDAG